MALVRCYLALHTDNRRMRRADPQVWGKKTVLICAALFSTLFFSLHAQSISSSTLTTAGAPVIITLAEAERRARTIEPTLQAALAARGTTAYNRALARSALLPQASILGQYLFTQSNGTNTGGTEPSSRGPVFIANNSVHEYTSQGQATETLSFANAARYQQTKALALQARAQLEIASRGLHVVVTQTYYSVEAAQNKLEAALEAQQSAQDFLDITTKLEEEREVAHADVLKAQLQLAQTQRNVADAELAASEARESLGVLLFPNPATPYVLADPLNTDPGAPGITIPEETTVQSLAGNANPDLRSALEALRASDADVLASRAGYLPALSLAYDYGIDAPSFETRGPQGQKFLGYSASATITIPVWDWFATRARIQQSELLRNQNRAALSYAQRQLIARLNASYGELKTAAANLISLQHSVQDSKESLRLAILQYQAGQAIVLEVVNAESQNVAAETAAADGALRYHVARANLERLTGTLP